VHCSKTLNIFVCLLTNSNFIQKFNWLTSLDLRWQSCTKIQNTVPKTILFTILTEIMAVQSSWIYIKIQLKKGYDRINITWHRSFTWRQEQEPINKSNFNARWSVSYPMKEKHFHFIILLSEVNTDECLKDKTWKVDMKLSFWKNLSSNLLYKITQTSFLLNRFKLLMFTCKIMW